MKKYHKHYRDRDFRDYKSYEGTALWSIFGSIFGLVVSLIIFYILSFFMEASPLIIVIVSLLSCYYFGAYFALVFYLGGPVRRLCLNINTDPGEVAIKTSFDLMAITLGWGFIIPLFLRATIGLLLVPFAYPFAIRKQVIAHKYGLKELPYQF